MFFDKKTRSLVLRTDFLIDGLFRFTQPRYLNDKGSEAKCVPYFNEFSPADIAWAKNEFYKQNKGTNKNTPPIDELIDVYLCPMGIRYGDSFPHLVKQQTDFSSMNEYDKN